MVAYLGRAVELADRDEISRGAGQEFLPLTVK
jgi:hypothetical protein